MTRISLSDFTKHDPQPPDPPDMDMRFFSSGSYLLDLHLGGGWARSRIINLIGDPSTGKTLLGIEACANFVRQGGDIKDIKYVETEDAFDEEFARCMGLPEDLEITADLLTVEDIFEDLDNFTAERRNKDESSLYIIDSLDAASDREEMKRPIDEGTFGAAKAKLLSQLFRRKVKELGASNCTLFVISQIRQKLGVMFGDKRSRSGGMALEFYASQIVWLKELGKIERTVRGVKRIIGVDIRARVSKNKLGPKYRECSLPLMFNYGIDDELAMLEWAKENKLDIAKTIAPAEIVRARESGDRRAVQQINNILRNEVGARYQEIEDALRSPMRKY